MPINLTKGSAPRKLENTQGQGLSQIYIGLGWDCTGSGVDLDASIACLGQNDKLLSDQHFIFYNNLATPDGKAVVHSGDNKTGQGEGDDESIRVDLLALPAQVSKLLLVISLHDAGGKNFTHVKNASFRIVDAKSSQETHRLDLSAGQGGQTECLIFAEIIRDQAGWSIKPVCYSIQDLGALLGSLQG